MLTTTLTIPDVNQVQDSINQTVSNIDWSAGSKDLIILLIFALSILMHVFGLKKSKIFSLLFSIYISYIVVLFFPYHLWLSHLPLEQVVWGKVAGFVLLIIILMVIFIRSRVFSASSSGIIARVLQSIVFGILNIGLCLSLLATLLPLEFMSQFSGLSLNILTTDLARFIWVILPLILFLFFVKFRRRGPGRPALDY